MNDEEDQNVDRAVPLIVKLALLDRTRDRMPDRLPFQDLKARLLIGKDYPETPLGQSLSISVAPGDLFGTLLEMGVDSRCLPIPSAMRLKVDMAENVSNRSIADDRNDTILDRLAGQILAGPVSDVQSLGDRLQARQSDDLSPLQGEIRAGRPGRWGGARRSGKPEHSYRRQTLQMVDGSH